MIDNIIGIDGKYKEENLLLFLREIIHLIKEQLRSHDTKKSKETIDFWFENLGIIESDFLIIQEMNHKKSGGSKIKQENQL